MGDFKNDIREGYGIIYGNNSDKYEGQWFNDQGNVYNGFWKNGLRDGFGVLTTQDGVDKKGIWKEGVFTEEQNQNQNCSIF